MIRNSTLKICITLACIFTLLPAFSWAGGGKKKSDEPSPREPEPTYGGTYRRALGHEPSTLDPAKIADVYAEVVAQQIFEGLVQYSENLMIVPALAESWESSRDNLR
jgi:ABC-type transport system substrate-binding protein